MQPFYSKLHFLYFLEAKNPCFVTKNCWKSSYICVFILSKKCHNWFHKNLHNSEMVGRRKLPDPSFNHIFSALLIGEQYTLSFQLTNFGLKGLIRLVFVFIFVFWRDHNGNKAPQLFCVIPAIILHVLFSSLIKNF